MIQVYEKDRISFPEFFEDQFFKELRNSSLILKSLIDETTD